MKSEKKKSGGFLAGLLFIVIGVVLLWWNEGNDVKNIKTIEEAKSVLISVSSDNVNNENEGKLVSTNGKLEVVDEYLLDSTFNLQSPKTAKLVRIVEMLQWVEKEKEDSDGNVDYYYEKKWLTKIESSSSFNDSSKVNPSSMPYDSEEFYANDVSLGAFTLSNAQKELLSTGATITLGESISLPSGYYRSGNYISTASDLSSANVGDVRISYKYNNDKEISILAKQSGNSFVPYESKQGKILFRVESGILTGEEIINVVENENNILKWVLRVLGIIFNMAGFSALLSPIAFLVKWIPFLGEGIANFIKSIGALVGLAVSFVVIAISWIFFRPLVGILLLAGVVGIIIIIVMLLKKSRSISKSNQSVFNQGVEQQMMQQPQQMAPQQNPQIMPQQTIQQNNQSANLVQQQSVIQQQVTQQHMSNQQSVVNQQVIQQQVNPLEQQQLQAMQQINQEQQNQIVQQQNDPLSIFGQNNNQ